MINRSCFCHDLLNMKLTYLSEKLMCLNDKQKLFKEGFSKYYFKEYDIKSV